MRMIFIGKTDVKPFAPELCKRLAAVIDIIIKNPNNPRFYHYVFESFGAMIRFCCADDPAMLATFEAELGTRFAAITAAHVDGTHPSLFWFFERHVTKRGGCRIGTLHVPADGALYRGAHGHRDSRVLLCPSAHPLATRLVGIFWQCPGLGQAAQRLFAKRRGRHSGKELPPGLPGCLAKTHQQQNQRWVWL